MWELVNGNSPSGFRDVFDQYRERFTQRAQDALSLDLRSERHFHPIKRKPQYEQPSTLLQFDEVAEQLHTPVGSIATGWVSKVIPCSYLAISVEDKPEQVLEAVDLIAALVDAEAAKSAVLGASVRLALSPYSGSIDDHVPGRVCVLCFPFLASPCTPDRFHLEPYRKRACEISPFCVLEGEAAPHLEDLKKLKPGQYDGSLPASWLVCAKHKLVPSTTGMVHCQNCYFSFFYRNWASSELLRDECPHDFAPDYSSTQSGSPNLP